MNVALIRTSHLQTFSGADVDQRFARDDGGDDQILRERTLHPTGVIRSQDEPSEPTPPPDQDEGQEYGDNSKQRNVA